MARREPIAIVAVTACLALALGMHAAGSARVDAPVQALAAKARPGSDTVVKVLDGESIEVRRGADTVTVRLLNVDAPDPARDDHPAECGADEATAWLTRHLPAGTGVTIHTDDLEYDWYQRELGWVVTDDGRAVNADIVRAGWAAAVAQEPNITHGPEVAAAQKEAAAGKAGLFAGSPCSLGARVTAEIDDLEKAAQRAERISRDSHERAMRTISRSLRDARRLQDDLAEAADTAEGRLLGQAAIGRLRHRLDVAEAKAARVENRIVAAEEARIARALAAERARIRRAEERRAAEREAARRAAEPKKSTPTATPTGPASEAPAKPPTADKPSSPAKPAPAPKAPAAPKAAATPSPART